MPSEELALQNLVFIVAAAALGGLIAARLKQPIILGYLVAGVAIGPFTPGPAASVEGLRFLIEIGVALLLFVLGAGMPLSRFRQVGGVVIAGGALQIGLTMALGVALAPLFGLGFIEGILLGTILAQSSSAVISKIMEDRRETGSLHGRIAVGMSVVQDISSGPLLLMLLVLSGSETQDISSISLAVLEVLGLTIGAYVVGRLLWPRVVHWAGRSGSGELNLLTALALALGTGLILDRLGLSFAMGGFLAGVVAAEALVATGAVRRISAVRDVFAALFFVSIGMLLDPGLILNDPLRFLALLGAVTLGKAVISASAIGLFRYPLATALLGGLLLAQIGEFAFVVANIGLNQGVLSQSMFSLVIAAAIVSIGMNSLLLDHAPRAYTAVSQTGRFVLLGKRLPGIRLLSRHYPRQPLPPDGASTPRGKQTAPRDMGSERQDE